MSEIDVRAKESFEEIKCILQTGNFQTVKKKFGRDRLRGLLLSLYPRHTILEIEKLSGIPDSTLGLWFAKLDIPRKRWHIKSFSKAAGYDSAKIRNRNKPHKLETVTITPELAYVIGFALGDGSVEKYSVEVFNKDKELRTHLYNFIQPYGTVNETVRPDGLWKIRLSSLRIANLIKNNKKPNKHTLEYIFKRNGLARRFVAAFWDAEGSVRKEKNYTHIYLYNSDKELIDEIGKFLDKRGIEHSLRFNFNPHRVYYLRGRPVRTRKKVYRISIPKSSQNRWIKEIGVHMLHTKKKKVVEEILKEMRVIK